MLNKFKKINNLILNSESILLITHPQPDGDALGSACALVGYLKSLKKNYRIYCKDPVPKHFRFLPWYEEIEHDYLSWVKFQPDLMISLDLPDWERTGIKPFVSKFINQVKIVTIDHHADISSPADVALINTAYSSTAEILYHLFTLINFVPNRQVASALLTGLLTDTENFTNQGTTIRSLNTASELMRLGASFGKLTQATWRFRKFDDLRLFGLALSRLQYNRELGLAVTIVKEDDLSEFDLGDDPFTGFPNFLKGLTSGKAALLLVERQGVIKGSLRSIDPLVDVRKLAEVFGGGGHRVAAGFTVSGSLEKTNGRWQLEAA